MNTPDQSLATAIDNLDVAAASAAIGAGANPGAYRDRRSMIGCCLDAMFPWPGLFNPRGVRIVRLLLDAGANPDAPSDAGEQDTALHDAAMHGPPGIVEALLDAGANPNLECDGQTALDIAEFDYFHHSMNEPEGERDRILAHASLPDLPVADSDVAWGHASDRWIRWSQQQFIPALRRRGARRGYELEPRSINKGLWLNADIFGGIATGDGVIEDCVRERLSTKTREAIAMWCERYINPWVVGFEANAVAEFDYDNHARQGLCLARRLVADLVPSVPVYAVSLPRAALEHGLHRTDVWKWTRELPVFKPCNLQS